MIEVHARSIPAYEVRRRFLYLPGAVRGARGDRDRRHLWQGRRRGVLMALTSSAVESQGREIEHPARVLHALNQLLAPRLKANHMNAALLFTVIDPYHRVMNVANAG